MRVQLVKLADYRPVFKQNENKNQDMDRPVTAQDLHDMEERLTTHMDQNFKAQNTMLGIALGDLASCAYYRNSDWHSNAIKSANNLKS